MSRKKKKLKFKKVVVGPRFYFILMFICMFCMYYYMKSPSGSRFDKEIAINDEDGDGVEDNLDIARSAEKIIEYGITYEDKYYREAYPPSEVGSNADMIWRSFKAAGFDLKSMIDNDIANNENLYPRTYGRPDPNMDFRRIVNLKVFFERNADSITTRISTKTDELTSYWKPGDIIIMSNMDHIAILADKKNKKGLPLVIHHYKEGEPKIEDKLEEWKDDIDGHYRFPKSIKDINE